MLKNIEDCIRESIAAKTELLKISSDIEAAADILISCYKNGGQAIFFGNGGSAADSQHLAAEMVGRFAYDRDPLPALALNSNSSAITAIGNDYGYDLSFARQLKAHAKPGDVAIGISTSGKSVNVIEAAKLKDELGIKFIGLTGNDASALAAYSDAIIAVPSKSTPRIQECHILVGHILCKFVEEAIFPR